MICFFEGEHVHEENKKKKKRKLAFKGKRTLSKNEEKRSLAD